MHALKSPSLSKINQDEVINDIKKSSLKDGNAFGMIIKSLKPKIISSDGILKSPDKTSDLKVLEKSKNISSKIETIKTNLDKRKSEKSNHANSKKIKCNITNELNKSQDTLLSKDLTVKNIHKSKSLYPKTYVCKFCCRRFYSEEQLQQHSKSHGSKPGHICYLCSHQTATFSALMTHYLRHSGTKGDKLEKIYAKSKADFSNIQFNIASRPKPSFSCSKCKLSFNTKSKYEAHNCSAVVEKGEYNCAYCGHVSYSVIDYRNHVQTHAETPFICSLCKYKAQTKKQLDKHLEHCKHHSKISTIKKSSKKIIEYKCDKCTEFRCKYKKELFQHLTICNSNTDTNIDGKLMYTCINCSSEFDEKKNYIDHVFVCDKASSNEVKEKSNLNKGVKLKILKESAKKKEILCDACGTTFNSKSEHKNQCVAIKIGKKIMQTLCQTCGQLINDIKFSEHVNACSHLSGIKTTEKKSVLSNRKPRSDKIETSKRKKLSIKLEGKAILDENKTNLQKEITSNCSSLVQNESSLLEKVSENNIDKNYNLSKNETSVKNEDYSLDNLSPTRRSTRLVRRKSSFLEDDDIVIKRKPIKIKIAKKPKIVLKPKFRRGKYKNTANSFLCNVCEFSFCSKSTLLRHKRMHSGNPWYICQYCGKFFFRKDVYIRHEMNVHRKSSKPVYCCCYCKLCFKESSSLKDHVLAEHKDSALLPSKQRVSKKIGLDAGMKFTEIKQESGAEEEVHHKNAKKLKKTINKNIPVEASTTSAISYKCSVCMLSFHNSSDVAIHMLTHPGMQSNNTDGIHNENSSNASKSITFNSESVFSSEKTNVSVLQNNNEDSLEINSNIKNILATDELLPNLNLPSDKTKMSCMLCSNEFSNKSLLEAHSKTMHKIVDWYRCLICSASGPKQDMQEHMFSHMFKVGTFIVNSNSRNFDAILSCVELEEDRKEKVDKHIDVCKEKCDQTEEISDLICDEELPPLREYGICACIDSKLKEENTMPDLQKETEYENKWCNSQISKIVQEESSLSTGIMNDISMISSETELRVSKSSLDSSSNALDAVVTVKSNDREKAESSNEEREDESIIKETDPSEVSSSSQIKEEHNLSFQSDSSVNDNFQSDGFSQLKYLLEKPSPSKSSGNKSIPYSTLTETSGFNYESTNPFEKYSSNVEENKVIFPSQQNQNVVNLETKSDFELPKQNNNILCSEINYNDATSSEINPSTCLKFDVNQSRSEFSETVIKSTLHPKPRNSILDKTENIFKPCPSQSAILDFSDLIQHSFENSSPCDDNIFLYSTPIKHDTSHNDSSNREEVHTPDCIEMVNYDYNSFISSVKCKYCNEVFENNDKHAKHKCVLTKSKDVDFLDKTKSTFKPLHYAEDKNAVCSTVSLSSAKLNFISPFKSPETFICAKENMETECERLPKSEHFQNAHFTPQTSNRCNRCHKNFGDIKELMKHSLSCLKSLFFKHPPTNLNINEGLTASNIKVEPKENISDFSLNSYNSTELPHQYSEDLSHSSDS